MGINSKLRRQELINLFPNLQDDPNFKILSPETKVYNCIAWAMQFDDRWVTPFIDLPGYWWPDGVNHDLSPETLIKAFEAVGFTVSDNSKMEDGFDKVVLYKKKDADMWTHAARIVSNDKEHSKFGESYDASHSHNVLCDTRLGCEYASYGVAYAYMKRPVSYGIGLHLFGNVTVDPTQLQKFGLPLP